MPVKVFQELGFLLDLQRELQDSRDLDYVDDAQIVVLDRQPVEQDLLSLVVPAIVIVATTWTPDGGMGGRERITYTPLILCITEGFDASAATARFTAEDAAIGAAQHRENVARVLGSLGPREDGAFRLSKDGSINYVELEASDQAVRMVFEDGRDFSVPALQPAYDIEF